mgnify:CR=1 FL=1
MMGCKDIQGPLSHISCQHYTDPHILQYPSYVRLTSASLGGRYHFAAQNLIVLTYCQYSVILTMTEMVIDHYSLLVGIAIFIIIYFFC